MPENDMSLLQKSVDNFIKALDTCDSIEYSMDIDDTSEDDGWGEIPDNDDEAAIAHLIEEESSRLRFFVDRVATQSKQLLHFLKIAENNIFKISSYQIDDTDKKIKELRVRIENFTQSIDTRSTELTENKGINEHFTQIEGYCQTLCKNLALLTRVRNLCFAKSDNINRGSASSTEAVSSKAEAVDSTSYEEPICNVIKEMAEGQIEHVDFKDCSEDENRQLQSFYLLCAQEHILMLIQDLENKSPFTVRKKINDRDKILATLKNFDEKVISQFGEKYSEKTHSAWFRCAYEESSNPLSEDPIINIGLSVEKWEEDLKFMIIQCLGDNESGVSKTAVQNIKNIITRTLVNLARNYNQMVPSTKVIALTNIKRWLETKEWFNKYPEIKNEVLLEINLFVRSLNSSTSRVFPERPSAKKMRDSAGDFFSTSKSPSSDAFLKNGSVSNEQELYANSWVEAVIKSMRKATKECESEVKDGDSAIIFGDELKEKLERIINADLANLRNFSYITPEAKDEAAHKILEEFKKLLSDLKAVKLSDHNEFVKNIKTLIINFRGVSADPMDISTQNSSSSSMHEKIDLIEREAKEKMNIAISNYGNGLVKVMECYIRENQKINNCDDRLDSARRILEHTNLLTEFVIPGIGGAKELGLAINKITDFVDELNQKNNGSISAIDVLNARKRSDSDAESELQSPKSKRQKKSNSSSQLFSSNVPDASSSSRNEETASEMAEEEISDPSLHK